MVLWACGALLNWPLEFKKDKNGWHVLYDIPKLLMLQPLTTTVRSPVSQLASFKGLVTATRGWL
ncbi:hypothetical protein HMPREF2892_05885 [Aerococcus sp. HMSC061A03]|nr:hypothetical protein HMPREF2892_05885 [Aerococcus sp. HMSC061A03]